MLPAAWSQSVSSLRSACTEPGSRSRPRPCSRPAARKEAFPSARASAGGSAPSPERTSSGANWRSSRSESKRQSLAGSTTRRSRFSGAATQPVDGGRPAAVVDRELPALEVEARIAQPRGAHGALDLRVVQPPAHACRAANRRAPGRRRREVGEIEGRALELPFDHPALAEPPVERQLRRPAPQAQPVTPSRRAA